MVRLRLRRVGRKKQPSYRLVAADKESPRDGRFLEIVGFYNPRTEPETITLKEDRIYHWLKNGAQPSDAADRIFKTTGLWDRYERFKGGEDIEKLLKEAADAEASRNIDGKTRRKPPKKSTKKQAEAEVPAEEPKAEEPKAEAKEEPKAEEAKEEEKKEEPKAEEPAAEEAKEEPAAEEEKPEAAEEEEKKDE